jgi:hypothetical protein
VEQGGVRLGRDAGDLQLVADPDADVAVAEGMIVNVGKRRFARLRIR